jgi:hypothetical protein
MGQENDCLILLLLGFLLSASTTIVISLLSSLDAFSFSFSFGHRITVDKPVHTYRRTRFDLFLLVFIPPGIEPFAATGKSPHGKGGGLAIAFKEEIERRGIDGEREKEKEDRRIYILM